MSMTTGDELGKSDVFVKLAVTLFPLAEEAMRQGMTMKEFESGLFGGLLCTGKCVLDQFLIAQGDGDLGETTIHPDDSNDDRISEPRKLYRSSEAAARVLRTVFGEHEFSAWVYREGEDRKCQIVLRPVDEQLGISPDRYSPLVRLMDGQHSLWADADACLGAGHSENMIDILDIVHVSGYVGKAAKVLCRGKAAQEVFIRQRLLRILKGEVQAVIRGLRRMATAQGLSNEKRGEVESACGYFATHAHRMKYDEYLAAGLPIATGVIEGAYRHVVKDRLERSGMRWSTCGAQGMLSLRSLKASDAWDEFHKQFLNPTPLNA